jgi:hypothetical protein
MKTAIKSRQYRRLSLDGDDPNDRRKGQYSYRSLDRLMRQRPEPAGKGARP